MNFKDIEIAPFDNLLVYKKGYTREFVAKVIQEKKLGGLRIFSLLKNEKLDGINFLEEYSFLEKLDITSSADFNFSPIKKLTNLRKLSINVEGSSEIDLGSLTYLEYLSIKWRKKIKGLDSCTSLSSLCLIEYKEPDLMKISGTNLIDLRIKTASIESLNGLQGMVNLRQLSVGNCKKLTSVEAANDLPKLQELVFEKCPGIKDYESITNLPSLDRLSLIDCGRIESIKFIDKYPMLSSLSLLGNTVINDGDLQPARRVKSVEHKHYRHYNIIIKNPSYQTIIKENLQKIKKWFK